MTDEAPSSNKLATPMGFEPTIAAQQFESPDTNASQFQGDGDKTHIRRPAVPETSTEQVNECGCPEWVIRCLHHRGACLRLIDWQLTGLSWWGRFHVCDSSESVADPVGDHAWCRVMLITPTNDFSEALAAFEEREREILAEVFA